MKLITIRFIVSGKNYTELMDKIEEKLSSLLGTSLEDLQSKATYEIVIYESNSDGVEPPTFSAESIIRLK